MRRQGVLGGVQGAESLFLWRAIGAAVLTLVPATAYSLKVSLRPSQRDNFVLCSCVLSVISRSWGV